MSILKNVKLYCPAAAVAAASNTDDDSTAVDTAGYDGILFVCAITDSANTGVATMTAEQGAVSAGTDAAALSGAVATATSAADDDLNTKLLAVDVYKPRERYVRVNRISATANIAYGAVIAILYQGSKAPVAQLAAEVAHSVAVSSPAEA